MTNQKEAFFHQQQLTFAPRGHQLTNINVWTPDSQWLAYDVRPNGSTFSGLTIERVNCITREIEVIYRAQHGAHVGVVTVSPDEPARYVFIHGPEHPDSHWHYDFHHRRGVIVTEPDRELAVTLDAMDISAPYTAGALRGGSHVHVFSPDGSRLSFTYNDHVLHERDCRNVGVAVPLHGVNPPKQHPREYDGSHFCVLVTRTTPTPQAGSDQINRAYEEGWVGTQGYVTADGRRQRWALAFIGDTLSAQGEKVPEIYLVDLPEHDRDYARAGAQPLEGTETTLPAPPMGVSQRRITFTAERRFPGLATSPRHWLRASPDGSAIACLMKDDSGIVQMWLVSPNGGEPRQLTFTEPGIQSAFSWHPQGHCLAFVSDNTVMLCDSATGQLQRLTARSVVAPLADAVVFSPDGTQIAFMREIDGFTQIFTVNVPE
ncbi:biopolymer transporter Tol [Yersinia frederiksenii]|nr:biopolymer transporter Tol [Yersinia frederiksenii]